MLLPLPEERVGVRVGVRAGFFNAYIFQRIKSACRMLEE
jgi:hypothetical protein